MNPEQRARLLATFGVTGNAYGKWKPRSQHAEAGEILIYGAIVPHGDIAIYRDWFGDDSVISNQIFREKLSKIEGEVNLRVNSPGGDVWEASAMVQAVSERIKGGGTVNTIVDGVAASAASLVILPSNEIVMASLATIMIHSAWTWAVGNADELKKSADLLTKLDQQVAKEYSKRMKADPDEAMRLMKDETWFTAEEAVEAGLADRVYEAKEEDEEGKMQAFQRSRRRRMSAILEG